MDVRITGQGRNLVLLHSLLSDRSGFAEIASRLSAQRRLILVNLPGFGSSPPAGPTIGDYAERLAAMFDDLALSGETDVLGNGLGSFVAMALALRNGSRLDRLVLVGTAAAFPEVGRATFRVLADKVEGGTMADVVDAAMGRMFPQDYIAANPDVIAERKAVFNRIDSGVFVAACRALAKLDLGPDLPAIQNPTLIVVGANDTATPPPLGRDLASRLARAELIELPGLGHSPHIQDPDRFVAAIAPFLGLDLSAIAH